MAVDTTSPRSLTLANILPSPNNNSFFFFFPFFFFFFFFPFVLASRKQIGR